MSFEGDAVEESPQVNHPRNTSSPLEAAQPSIPSLPQQLPPPVEGQHSEKDANATHESKAGKAAASLKGSRTGVKDSPILFTINWICVVLGVTAAIVFGIWAPLSYEATANGNRDSNVVQSSMISALSVANDVASSALSAAKAQSAALGEVQNQLGAMGQLALVDFCVTETVGCIIPKRNCVRLSPFSQALALGKS